jgi:uncharacterized membrane-anchored protein
MLPTVPKFKLFNTMNQPKSMFIINERIALVHLTKSLKNGMLKSLCVLLVTTVFWSLAKLLLQTCSPVEVCKQLKACPDSLIGAP